MDNDLPNKLWDDAELLVRKLLLSLPQDLSSEVVSNTPKRVVKHLLKEMYGVPQPKMTVFHEDSVNSMVIQNLIPFSSSCEHHMLPFFGTATVAYIPNNGRIVGLSKLARLVQFYAQGLQVQERITHRVGKHLAELKDLHPLGVAVSLQAVHSCMSCRGVRALNTVTMTQFLYGEFETNPATRQEFFSLVKH